MTKESSDETEETNKGASSAHNQYLAALTCSVLSFFYGQAIGWSSFAVPQLMEGVLNGKPFTQAEGETAAVPKTLPFLEVPKTREKKVLPIQYGLFKLPGWVGGSLCLGAIVASPVYGLLANAMGRKFIAYVAGVLFLTSWCMMVAADSLIWVMLARFVAGVGCAGAITVVTTYNNEIAEQRVKASIGGVFTMVYAIGLLFAYVIGAWVAYTSVVVINCCLCTLFFPAWWYMPETPAYLVLKGREEEALQTLKWLLGPKGSSAQNAFNRLKQEQEGADKHASFKEFFQDAVAKKGIVLALILITVQTFSGVFAVFSYASAIISHSGGLLTSSAGCMLFGCVMVCGSLLPMIIGDKLPRKVCLGISCGMLSLGMMILGTLQLLQARGLDLSHSWLGVLPILVLSATAFFHFAGLGSVTFLAIMELFSDKTRGVAGSLVSTLMWFDAFIVLQFFGVAVEAFGDYSVFFFFSCVCAFGLFFVSVFFPELGGKTPNEVAAILLNR